jgi:CxxC motif-containing protein
MRSLTCIVCPIGCALTVDEDADGVLAVRGNKCKRGSAYAQEEIRTPKRVVTATCKVFQSKEESKALFGTHRRVPVKSNVPCPKEKIDDLLKDIYNTTVKLPVKSGDVIISNWNGCGLDVIAIRSMQ